MQPSGLVVSIENYDDLISPVITRAERENVVSRIWTKDVALWKSEEAHQRTIRKSLGWLNAPLEISKVANELMAFADEIRGSGEFDAVMLSGMGGSSLCPEVLRQIFGARQGYPPFFVLDSTDPDVIAAFAKQVDVTRCLFIIASKSGTTTEPLAFYKYWYSQVAQAKPNPGDSFVAITDPETPMVGMATEKKFRRIFLSRPDIGGRYSAFTYFGMVPAVLMGVEIKQLLERATRMAAACSVETKIQDNPGARLGAIMGECGKIGRDKLTLVTDERVAALGLWIEQLVAESTGKEGKGILPVNQEPLGSPAVYNDDRLFVSISVGEPGQETQKRLHELKSAGHPIVHRILKDSYDLGAEFFLWQFATAFAGWCLGINPFNQPNVQESKIATKELLEQYVKKGTLSDEKPLVSAGTLTVYANHSHSDLPPNSVLEALRDHLAGIKIGDYIALLVYIEQTQEIEKLLQRIRTYLRDSTKCATTIGYGPRFLHSTGQLHKGGPDTGVFLQLTAPDNLDISIPTESYTFSILKQAQALGDFRALTSHKRRAIRVDLENNPLTGLHKLFEIMAEISILDDGSVANM